MQVSVWDWKDALTVHGSVCLGPSGYELLSPVETGGPKTVHQPFFVADATELCCHSCVPGFWINFETLNDVVLITGPFIPVLRGLSA